MVLEESGPAADQAVAIDSMFARDPFRVVNPANMVKDPFFPNNGVIVFAEHLTLAFFEPPSTVGVVLVDSTNPGTCTIKLVFHNHVSNTATFRIAP